jgi:uncharacterized protein YneF (UPF0154 family)
MSTATVFALVIVALVVGFVVGFFVGGKHKESLLRKVGIIKATAEEVAGTIKDVGKRL